VFEPAQHRGVHEIAGADMAMRLRAAHAFEDLTARLEAAAQEPLRPARLRRMAICYVEFAVAQPARFDLMWRSEILDPNHREYRDAADRAFAILDKAVRGSDEWVEFLPTPRARCRWRFGR
jgi:Tetracyclin repressor-like, C-terminal domain